MGIFRQRKRILKIRKIKKTMKHANKECERELDKLNRSDTVCSCPYCKRNEHVKYVGTNNGTKKFRCDASSNHKQRCFSTSTSYEAIEIYREAMARNLCLLTHTNSDVCGIRQYNESSKYFAEYAFEALYEFITKEINQPQLKINKGMDIVTIFFDLSGSMLSKNKAIILAKIEDRIIFEIVTHSNYLSANSIISSIKARLKLSKKTQIVFVSDGERCYVDSIRHYFPNAIHIRQFHKQSCRGIIYVHFKYKKYDYTIRCLWDCVLDEGKPSNDVVKQRRLKAQRRINDKERKKEAIYSELSKDVMVWKGIVYLPRGVRRMLKGRKKLKNLNHRAEKTNTSDPDTPQLVFRGSLKEAKKLKVMQYCLKILGKIFGGLYITSNTVETIFNVKNKFAGHKTMKFGERILVCVLFCNLNGLKYKSKEELMAYFKEKVITYDLLMQKVLYGSGLQKNKREEPSFLELINKAISEKLELVIHYCDRFQRHTSRIIKPIQIRLKEYDNTTIVEAYCKLRKAKRIFYLERIRDAAIYDPKPILF